MQFGEEPLVKTAASIFQDLCYSYRDQLSAGIICAGWDRKLGGQVHISIIYEVKWDLVWCHSRTIPAEGRNDLILDATMISRKAIRSLQVRLLMRWCWAIGCFWWQKALCVQIGLGDYLLMMRERSISPLDSWMELLVMLPDVLWCSVKISSKSRNNNYSESSVSRLISVGIRVNMSTVLLILARFTAFLLVVCAYVNRSLLVVQAARTFMAMLIQSTNQRWLSNNASTSLKKVCYVYWWNWANAMTMSNLLLKLCLLL